MDSVQTANCVIRWRNKKGAISRLLIDRMLLSAAGLDATTFDLRMSLDERRRERTRLVTCGWYVFEVCVLLRRRHRPNEHKMSDSGRMKGAGKP